MRPNRVSLATSTAGVSAESTKGNDLTLLKQKAKTDRPRKGRGTPCLKLWLALENSPLDCFRRCATCARSAPPLPRALKTHRSPQSQREGPRCRRLPCFAAERTLVREGKRKSGKVRCRGPSQHRLVRPSRQRGRNQGPKARRNIRRRTGRYCQRGRTSGRRSA